MKALPVRGRAPTGQVRVLSELWEARSAKGADVGQAVRIEALDGLTLVVASEFRSD